MLFCSCNYCRCAVFCCCPVYTGYAVAQFIFAMLIAIIQPYKAHLAVYNIVDTVFILLLVLWCCTLMCLELALLKDRRYTTTSNEGLRTRVDQPKIKYLKFRELCKNAIKSVYTIWAHSQKLQIPKGSAASEIHFKSIPMLGGLTQHLWIRPLWFWALQKLLWV